MASGQSKTGTYKCKKCSGVLFKSMGELRIHQWADHRNYFSNLLNGRKNLAKKWICSYCGHTSKSQNESTKHYWATHRSKSNKEVVVKLNGAAPPQAMLASELLDKLKSQRNFITDVVSLIEGLIKN